MQKSISFFEAYYNDVMFNLEGNTQVLCPFNHGTEENPYYESRPSAGVHLEKGLFRCNACDRGFNEVGFASEIMQLPKPDTIKFLQYFHTCTTSLLDFKPYEEQLDQSPIVGRLNIPIETLRELHVGYSGQGDEFTLPIIMFGQIVDTVTYRPGQKPKYIRKKNSMSGLICPYDIWRQTTGTTYICAGEKDMMIARSKGLNAISFTGGEPNVPKIFSKCFKNRRCIIIYDNDAPGKAGSKALATALKKVGAEVKIVDLSSVCVEEKEDLYDFFTKYNGTVEQLMELVRQAHVFTEQDVKEQLQREAPLVELAKANNANNIDRPLRSNIQVIATFEEAFHAPTSISALKYDEDEDATMKLNEVRNWYLENDYSKLFYLIDYKQKEHQIEESIKTELLHIPNKEKYVRITKLDQITVYKAMVTDSFEDNLSDAKPVEFLAYSLDKPLENGSKYTIKYRIVPNPQDGQKLVMVIDEIETAVTFIENFEITAQVKKDLKVFQPSENQTFEEKYFESLDKIRGLVKAEIDLNLLEIEDLWFNTVLQIKSRGIDFRGYLETLIIGESGIGKSTTAEILSNTYKLGRKQTLNKNSVTLAGLIGGSDKMSGSYKTRAGVIPQSHKNALILDELAKCDLDVMKALTDIRSSNTVNISRVDGRLTLPALVRMLFLSNPKYADASAVRTIKSYANGIEIVKELIGTPEDIRRFDLIAIFGNEAPKYLDYEYIPPTPYSEQALQTRIRWIWSRDSSQIIIEPDIERYIVECANQLNDIFDAHIKVLGIDAWKKITRLAVAIAGYVVSTDESFQTIIVKKEHVDRAVQIMNNLYDNDIFRLREYSGREKRSLVATEEELRIFQEIFDELPQLIRYLSANTNVDKNMVLNAVAGTTDKIGRCLSILAQNSFIIFTKTNLSTTMKFSNSLSKLNTTNESRATPVLKLDKDGW